LTENDGVEKHALCIYPSLSAPNPNLEDYPLHLGLHMSSIHLPPVLATSTMSRIPWIRDHTYKIITDESADGCVFIWCSLSVTFALSIYLGTGWQSESRTRRGSCNTSFLFRWSAFGYPCWSSCLLRRSHCGRSSRGLY
jgi:hypothetical protein